MTDNQRKILEDAVKVLADLAVTAASGGAAVGVLATDAPTAKDALERILLELPPIDAADLDPAIRANADAQSDADETAKFGPK